MRPLFSLIPAEVKSTASRRVKTKPSKWLGYPSQGTGTWVDGMKESSKACVSTHERHRYVPPALQCGGARFAPRKENQFRLFSGRNGNVRHSDHERSQVFESTLPLAHDHILRALGRRHEPSDFAAEVVVATCESAIVPDFQQVAIGGFTLRPNWRDSSYKSLFHSFSSNLRWGTSATRGISTRLYFCPCSLSLFSSFFLFLPASPRNSTSLPVCVFTASIIFWYSFLSMRRTTLFGTFCSWKSI